MSGNGFTHGLKVGLARAGRVAPGELSRAVALAAGYFQVGRWMREHGFADAPTVRGRTQVFQAVADEVADEQVLYLEFGVFQGASLRWWSRALRHHGSELHGFDSFEGLPETFDAHSYPQGTFNVGGQPPKIDDRRVHFHVGLFENTLPRFVVPDHERLVITLDADLYSATKLVLDHLAPVIRPGTVLYFDELSRVDHEPAAFADFMAATGRHFRAIALEDTYNTGAFGCIG